MQIKENYDHNLFTIESYHSGQIKINGNAYNQTVILSPDGLIATDTIELDNLKAEILLQSIPDMNVPELILIGTGVKQKFLHPRITSMLAAKGIGLESMHTAAAIQTYMILQSEGRKISAWLWP